MRFVSTAISLLCLLSSPVYAEEVCICTFPRSDDHSTYITKFKVDGDKLINMRFGFDNYKILRNDEASLMAVDVDQKLFTGDASPSVPYNKCMKLH